MLDALADCDLCGNAPIFLQTLDYVKRFAVCNATALLQGETGTGKEMAAHAIHFLGPRRGMPFISVNCGALPDNLLESEIFGHERGAFTDAIEARLGLVGQARGGTLFLDQVETMSPRGQVVLLRFLQDRSYRPVGGAIRPGQDVRIIAATNVELERLADRNLFRHDLLYRLQVLVLNMPPLRDREGDVEVLAERFLARFSAEYQRPPKRLHPETLAWFHAYHWPGNVRELKNLLLRGFLLTDGDVVELPPPPDFRSVEEIENANADPEGGFRRAKALAIARFERRYLETMLARTRGNVSLAARLSQKDRSVFARLNKKHGIDVARFRT